MRTSIKVMYVMLCDHRSKDGSGKSHHAELVCVAGRVGVEQGVHVAVQSLSTGCSLGNTNSYTAEKSDNSLAG